MPEIFQWRLVLKKLGIGGGGGGGGNKLNHTVNATAYDWMQILKIKTENSSIKLTFMKKKICI